MVPFWFNFFLLSVMSVKFTLLLIIDAQLIFLAFIPPGLAATSKFLLLYTLIFFVHFAYSHKLY